MDLPELRDKLLETMINADRTGASILIGKAISDGTPADTIVVKILDPALVRLGHLWGDESVSLAQTFVAAKIAEDILIRCIPDSSSPKALPCPGVIVIGNIEDDFHSLGRRIIASFLRATGWDVHDLGNDVPAEQFLEKALELGASVIGVSAMMQTTALNIRKLRDLIDSRGLTDTIKMAVGGAVFNWRPDLVIEVGGDGTAKNAAEVDDLFKRLQNEAKRGRGL